MGDKKTNGKLPIESMELRVANLPASFVFKTMEQVENEHHGDDPLPHRHNYYTIIWVKEGKGTHHIDFNTYEVGPGIIFFISPEQVHHLKMEPNHRGYVLLFTADFIVQHGTGMQLVQDSGFFFSCDDVAPLKLDNVDLTQLDICVENIEREYKEKSPLFLDAIGSWLKLFLLSAKRIADSHSAQREIRNHPKAQIIKEFKDLLDLQFVKWHKVADYAKELHITPNYLNEVLSQETGISAKDFIMNRILLEAKRHATYSELSAKEVAYQLGFDDPSHFSKLFKQHQTRSFSEFRDDIRKKYQ